MQIVIEHNAMTFQITSKNKVTIKEWLAEMAELIMDPNPASYTRIQIYPTNKGEEEYMKGARAFNRQLDPAGLRDVGDLFHSMAYERQEQLNKK